MEYDERSLGVLILHHAEGLKNHSRMREAAHSSSRYRGYTTRTEAAKTINQK